MSRLLYKRILTKWIHFSFNMDFASRFACIDYHQCNIFIHTLIYDYSKIQCGIDGPDNEESMEDLQWNWNCTANDKDIIFVDLSLCELEYSSVYSFVFQIGTKDKDNYLEIEQIIFIYNMIVVTVGG